MKYFQNKYNLILAIACLFHLTNLRAQLFQLAGGPVYSTASDSRSVNFFDLNKDAWQDLYISNGKEGGQKDLMYLNDGKGNFNEVRNKAIVDAENPSVGASFADFNNDGFIDAVITSWYGKEDLLYLNDGSGELNYVQNSGLAPGSNAEAAAFGDYNGDGLLDLYITNSGGNKKNYLYKNLGNGKFERIFDHILVAVDKPSRAAIWGDFNNDGHTDLYVTNEGESPNDLYYGKGNGDFEKLNRGSIVNKFVGTMTGSWGDIDNDGDLDLFVGNSGFFNGAKNQLYKNFGDSFGEDPNSIIASPNQCTFGSSFGDYDNDGDLDLIITNGFCNRDMQNVLYENQGDGTFIDASDQLPQNQNICSYGVAWGDVNNDGFLDLAIANCKNSATDTEKRNYLYLNQGNDNNWLSIKLEGIQSNRNAIGAKLRMKATINGEAVWQYRTVQSQTGYAGQNSMLIHFGLSDAQKVDSLIIVWPSGTEQVLKGINPNQRLSIKEGITTSTKSLELSEKITLRVFPNPITIKGDSFRLSIKNKDLLQEGDLKLMNAQGQLIWSQKIELLDQYEKTLSANQLQLKAGRYYLSFSTAKGQLCQKLIVN